MQLPDLKCLFPGSDGDGSASLFAAACADFSECPAVLADPDWTKECERARSGNSEPTDEGNGAGADGGSGIILAAVATAAVLQY